MRHLFVYFYGVPHTNNYMYGYINTLLFTQEYPEWTEWFIQKEITQGTTPPTPAVHCNPHCVCEGN